MANRIAGITVAIGGDTTKISTALKTVNSEIRSTQQQLKDVNHLLKLDPGNTDLLAQKQRLLRDAISETKEKLEALKTAAQQAIDELEEAIIEVNKKINCAYDEQFTTESLCKALLNFGIFKYGI